MMFPTIISKQDQLVHIIKNQQLTECGSIYHHFAIVTRTDLRQIKFVNKEGITCDICLKRYFKQAN